LLSKSFAGLPIAEWLFRAMLTAAHIHIIDLLLDCKPERLEEAAFVAGITEWLLRAHST
jgi:hypothetical protein